jgi:putative oxidoreductase
MPLKFGKGNFQLLYKEIFMATITATPQNQTYNTAETRSYAKMAFLAPLGRTLFSLIFILSGLGHFSQDVINYASQQGVPMPTFLVPFSGLMAVVGGLSILLGYRARIGAALLVLFLIPVTLVMHNFWSVTDPMLAQMQQAHFLKNVALLGGALLILYFGAGEISMDSKGRSSQKA